MEGAILVVENNGALRELLAGNLRAAGYRVSCACDVAEAEALARVIRPDAAIVDWMPGMPGLTFVRQLRSDRRTASAAIIVVSERSDEQDRVAALESGADDYVVKPFFVREVLARIKAVLRRRAPHLADDVVEVSGLRFDPAALRVTVGNREIELRKIEFQLLHFFLTHPHRTFSRRQLLDEVWGDHVFVEERTVDVHIRRLRRALAFTGHNKLIETVRGMGYRLRSEPTPAPAPAIYSTVTDLARARGLRVSAVPGASAA